MEKKKDKINSIMVGKVLHRQLTSHVLMKVKKQGWTCVLLNGKQFLLQSAPVVLLLKDTNIVWYGNSFEQNMWNKNQLIDSNTWKCCTKQGKWVVIIYCVTRGINIASFYDFVADWYFFIFGFQI